MSLRPLKASDQRKLNEKMQRRKKEIVDTPPPFIYIICEGTKTEPTYISGLASVINEKYRDLSPGRRVVVKGTGRNTIGLLKYARRQVAIDCPQASIVWLMYDKDDFPHDNFDNTQNSAQTKKDTRQYRVAWSNECIELWFVLHFQTLDASNGREHLKELLNKRCEYDKALTFEELKEYTGDAIKRARAQYNSYGSLPPSRRCPATRMFELVEYLMQYI